MPTEMELGADQLEDTTFPNETSFPGAATERERSMPENLKGFVNNTTDKRYTPDTI
jgi:hypothetical protein